MASGFFAGGAAQGFSNAFGQGMSAIIQMRYMKLMQQRQNLQGYQTFNQMLQTMDPGTLKAMWPSVSKNLFNVDPSDAETKSFYMQAIDSNSQIGQSVRDAFNSINGNDPNDPVANVMKTVPLPALAQMAKNPAQMTGFLSSVQQLKMQRQAQGLMSQVLGGGTSGSAPSAPSTLTSSTAIPAATPGGAAPTVAPGTLSANTQASAAPLPGPISTTTPVVGPAIQTTPTEGPVSALTSSAGDVATAVSKMRQMSSVFSLNPYTHDMAKMYQDQADNMERNFLTRQSTAVQASRAGAQWAQVAIDRQTRLGWQPQPQTPDQAAQGTTVLRNPAGDMKVVASNPAAQKYYETMADQYGKKFDDIQSAAENSTQIMAGVNEMRAINNGGDATAPPQGTFENERYMLGRLFDTLGMPNLAKGITKSAPGSEATDSILAQAAGQIAQKMRQGSMGSYSGPMINLVETQLPQLANTADGRNMILDILESGAQKAQGVYSIWSQHINGGTPPYMADQSGRTAEDKTMDYLREQQAVPASIQNRLNVMTGRQPVTATGQTSPLTTPLSRLSPSQFLQLMNNQGAPSGP